MEKKLNNSLKRRKPKFLRQDAHKKARLKKVWRKPKGLQNKVRLNKRGYRRMPSVGFKSPRAVRGKGRDGLAQVLVYAMPDLVALKAGTSAMIASSVGRKKKLELVKYALEKQIPLANVRDPAGFVKEVEQDIQKKKEAKEAKEKKRKEEEKKKEAEEQKKKEEKAKEEAAEKQKEAKKEEGEEPESIEDKLEKAKEEEKKEKDKVLTKKT